MVEFCYKDMRKQVEILTRVFFSIFQRHLEKMSQRECNIMTSLWAEVNDILTQIAYVVNNKLM